MNAVDGPDWLDAAAAAARRRLQRAIGKQVVGHGDWYTDNVRWRGVRLHAVHDWDSVLVDTETVVVGLAAAVFPATHAGTEATVEETEEFLSVYGSAQRRSFTTEQIQECWAAGLWIRCYDAKKQFATEGSTRSLERAEADRRLARLGNP